MTREELERIVLSALREFTRAADRVRLVARSKGLIVDRATWTVTPWYWGPPGLPVEIPTRRYRYYWPAVEGGVGCDYIDWFKAADVTGRLLFLDVLEDDEWWARRARYLVDLCEALPHEVLKALRGIERAANWCYRILGEEPRSILPKEVWDSLEMEGALSALSEI